MNQGTGKKPPKSSGGFASSILDRLKKVGKQNGQKKK